MSYLNTSSNESKVFTEELGQTLSNYCIDFRKDAFTLAEVLITLGIIGVVAAITMPSIVANVKEKSLESALKKSQSSLINGYKQLMARESIFKVSNLPIMECARNASCFSPWHRSTFKVVDDSTSGLAGTALPQEYAIEDKTQPSPFKWSDVPYMFRTADGMSYGVEIDEDKQTFSVYADINGQKAPNTVCKDMLKFRIAGVGNISNVCNEMAEVRVCSLDDVSACSYEQCQSLNQSDYQDTWAYGMHCGFDSKGHCIMIMCAPNGQHDAFDYCEFAKKWSPDKISSYCR